jgi:hypothetical protein
LTAWRERQRGDGQVLFSQRQLRTPGRSWCAVPAEQNRSTASSACPSLGQKRVRPPLKAHHGHGPSAIRREALRDCPLAHQTRVRDTCKSSTFLSGGLAWTLERSRSLGR